MLDTKELAKSTAMIVKQHVDAAVGPLLKRIEQLEAVQPLKGEPGKDGADGKDGASFTLDDAASLIDEAVTKAVALIPAPKDGKDGRDGKDAEPGPAGKDGRDGLDVKDLFRADGGKLVAVMSDGTTKDLGGFVGKDGESGKDGSDGRDGLNGKDGRDGFGFDDLDLVETEAGVMLRFVRGDQTKDFRLPIVIDRGVFNADKSYAKGDGVTWGGSFWIAQEETQDKPDSGKGWRLAVKKGRDGRDGTMTTEQRAKVKI